MEKISGIYKITCVPTGKVYIGQSIDINRRWKEHLTKLINNNHYNEYLQSAWNKYGESNFVFEILEFCEVTELNNREIYYIQKLKTSIRKNGFNLDSGGKSGSFKDEKSKEKLMKPVVQYSIEGVKLKVFKSINEASAYLNMTPSNITGICLKRSGFAGGYQWRYLSDNIEKCKPIKYPLPVVQYSLSGIKIAEFPHAHAALKATGIGDANIRDVCIGKTKTAGGFQWRFAKDNIEQCPAVRVGRSKPIIQMDAQGKFINKYNNIREAVDKTGLTEYQIKNSIYQSHLGGGYIWKYEEAM